MSRIVVSHLPNGVCIVYDTHIKNVVHDITDYGLFLCDRRNISKTSMRQAIWQVVSFWRFLLEADKGKDEISDLFLKCYRDHEVRSIQSRTSHRGSINSARRTVNQKISSILAWISWLQDTQRVSPGIIGSSNDDRVRTKIPNKISKSQTISPSVAVRQLRSDLLFRLGGSPGTSAPTSKRIDSAIEIIMEGRQSSYIKERDALCIDIAINTGFRRSSINSLRVDQFDVEFLLSTNNPTFPLKPQRQKFGYENEFEVPVTLGIRILEFIEGSRRELLGHLGKNIAHCPMLFVSARNGEPMSDRAMTQSISRAMRLAGAKRGQSLHAMRAFFADRVLEAEESRRLALGMDTSTASLSHAVSRQLGHRDPNSLFGYISSTQSRRARDRLAKMEAPLDHPDDCSD